ncbi:hypothetical protein CQW23_08914 [Capsicum baccatum]|uniref:Uncharacterized protein n=1 Tax=Capsicum baccatum TaxID=33114 RepID=A0A2G2XAB6_CAPBA|nr:hypothetical protein CQW23_08914 [Capsicum baccatum]
MSEESAICVAGIMAEARIMAEAHQRRALPAIIEETTFHERFESLGFGCPPIHAGPYPESISGSAHRHSTSERVSGHNGDLTLSGAPLQGLGPSPSLRTLLQTIIRTTKPPDYKAGLFPVRSPLIRESL